MKDSTKIKGLRHTSGGLNIRMQYIGPVVSPVNQVFLAVSQKQ